MGWERGRYYTRSRKVEGRVVREYVGAGPAAALAAESVIGQTPMLDADGGHREKVSVIGGVSVSPRQQRLGFYFATEPVASSSRRRLLGFFVLCCVISGAGS